MHYYFFIEKLFRDNNLRFHILSEQLLYKVIKELSYKVTKSLKEFTHNINETLQQQNSLRYSKCFM